MTMRDTLRPSCREMENLPSEFAAGAAGGSEGGVRSADGSVGLLTAGAGAGTGVPISSFGAGGCGAGSDATSGGGDATSAGFAALVRRKSITSRYGLYSG